MPVKTKWKPNKSAIKSVRKTMNERVAKTGKLAKEIVNERLSAKGMTSSDLLSRGSPYARKNGGFGDLKNPQARSPSQYVGRQSGTLKKSLKGSKKKLTYTLQFASPPFYSKFIFNGTRVMLPRQPMLVLMEKEKQDMLIYVFSTGGRSV